MGKKWMILVCLFSILTFLSSVICTMLVFFNEEARTSLNSNTVIASNKTYKSSSIIYNEPNNLAITGLNPGDSITKSFTITNNNSNTIRYKIVWDNVTSTWNDSGHPEEFIYSISCSNGENIGNKQMPIDNKNNTILENLELKTNKTNTCTITITFVNKEIDQSYNINKTFGGTYKVVVTE